MGIARTLISALVSIVEFLLSLRFVFKFFTVNAHAPFVAWLYDTTAPLVSPFVGIMPNLKLGEFVIDFSTLIALIVYVLVGYFILQMFSHVSPR
ncbi:MAG: hypothetical protein ACD_7C00126G0005 [uncultured bacterium]|nr:MAG: hypothetical protein ACD_7C00126G0005 [uncultured bacterium]KKP68477.1 MAG: hypothetical protein UR66_C0005G0024 [Candidatus Moranbacteria bacterium GW2011_GWE1_35_17]KKP70389.1 MAG: hypothetical protein UR65_C0044G0004 [Candidatus Moranbacteria bacterium GW2011_GWE2_35_164]KKP83779.1 MAG: hypothetical protein UR83_C0033G0009 [Candidatus Moranbacteria bacterium GW2011_GWF2_35_54]KKP84023.1 MAG: hypothetical protein UR82_C0014G0002 [Candidatus Moranbacteria bacterium GW2011_GWF1_35_5]HB